MKSYLSLIPISAKVRKRQNRMTVLCIIISVFLVTAIFSVADMMIRTESDFMISNHGNWHIAIKNISQNNADEISNRSDVTAVGVASQFNFEGEQPYRVNEKRTVLYGTDEVYITQISNGIVEGTFPANDEEVMLTPNSVTALGVQLGDTHYFGIEWRFPILWFGIVVAFIFISAIVSVYAPAKRIRNMPITATINEL